MIAVFRRELNGYFKSMMGYLFSAFVLIFAGIYTMVYNLSGYTAHFERVLSSISFLYLIAVPILTMRSVAEEKKQKTDQLLYSLPISLSSVVVGKYLAMLVVLLVPTAIMGLYPLILSQFGTVPLQTAYGALAGVCYSRWHGGVKGVYLSLLAALVGGRLVWGLVSIPIYGLLTEQAFTLAAFWMGGFVNAWPGIVLQIVLIPAIVLALEKAKLFQQQ